MSSKVTIVDIAEMLGISHSTVSRALNDSPRVTSETTRKVKELARKLDFEFNANARSLSRRKTGIIGVIYTSDMDSFGGSLYTNQLFLELRHTLETYDFDTILLEGYDSRTGDSNIARLVRQNKVDGFLVVHSKIRKEDYLLARESGLPLVQLHLHAVHHPMDELDHFVCDNRAGGRMAAERLIASGCRKLANITCPWGLPGKTGTEFSARTEGFLSVSKATSFAVEEITFQAAYRFVRENSKIISRFDGLFAHSDLMAFGCHTALKEAGIRIPSDMKLIGFDDSPAALLPDPALTTIHQPKELLTRAACKRLSELLAGGVDSSPPECGELSPELVVRGTA